MIKNHVSIDKNWEFSRNAFYYLCRFSCTYGICTTVSCVSSHRSASTKIIVVQLIYIKKFSFTCFIHIQETHQGEECLAIQASAASAPKNDITNNAATSCTAGNELDSDHYHNSFAMDELSRMLNMARTRDDNDPSGTSLVSSRVTANARTMSTNTFYGYGASRPAKIKPKRNNVPNSGNFSRNTELNNSSITNSHRRTAPRTTINSIQRSKRTNEQAENINGATGRNRTTERSQGNLSTANHTQDLDRLLAMHLAEELNGDVNLDHYYNPSTRNSGINAADYVSDSVFSGKLV